MKHQTTIHEETAWREEENGMRVTIKPDVHWFSCTCGLVGNRITVGHAATLVLKAAHAHEALMTAEPPAP